MKLLGIKLILLSVEFLAPPPPLLFTKGCETGGIKPKGDGGSKTQGIPLMMRFVRERWEDETILYFVGGFGAKVFAEEKYG